MKAPNHRRAVLLDRDGTILVERHYLGRPEDVALLPGAALGLLRMQQLGLLLIVITNQSGVGRGLFGIPQVQAVHGRMAELLAAEHVLLNGIYVCPHRPEEHCLCRKPLPGLALEAARDLDFDLPASFAVGDKMSDVELGRAVGATPILVRTGYGAESLKSLEGELLIADDLNGAATLIESQITRAPSELRF